MVHSSMFLDSLSKCDAALSELPNPPLWSIKDVINAESIDISKAQFSQPLCTAVQIALVDLLFASGVRFDAVVGHSSGEIGAAYASGILSAKDAIAIAYYRGVVAHLSKGEKGQVGGMMAVGMSLDDATALCSQSEFAGRIWVAASNAPISTTLSGDQDAVLEAKEQIDKKGIFARPLKVDTAYHSLHMLHCKDEYLSHLKQLAIQPQQPRNNCHWYSSVYDGVDLTQAPIDQFKDQYWVDNMVKPVLFTQAVSATFEGEESYAIGLEVGPHSSLKGPVGQTLKSLDKSLPYIGCLDRGSNDVDSFSGSLGLIWSYLGPAAVDFNGWRRAFRLNEPKVLKGLPSYSWDHDRIYWHESRLSHHYRLGVHSSHELLGRLREDHGDEMTWKNILRLSEIPWLRGHKFQGQVIFPAAGYVSMAVQAAQEFARESSGRLIEILDLEIIKALVIEESADVETVFTIRKNSDDSMKESVTAEFVCYSSSDGLTMEKSCSGRLIIDSSNSAPNTLPPVASSQKRHPPLDVERFFTAMAGLGIQYDGLFRALQSINRTIGHATASASWGSGELGHNYSLHPAMLDIGFQVGFATFASIAENSIGSTYLPAGIKRVIVDPTVHSRSTIEDTTIGIETHLACSTMSTLEVDISMFNKSTKMSSVQVEGLILRAVAEPLPSDDRLLFAKTVWNPSVSTGFSALEPAEVRSEELEYIDAVERTALFFMQKLKRDVSQEEIPQFRWYHQAYIRAIDEFIRPVHQGRHPVLRKEWLNDTRETISGFAKRFQDSVDLGLLTAVGENIASVMRGESEMLEHMLKNNLLSRLYMEGRGFARCNIYAADFMKRISHSFPRTKILEVGAGTGGTTRSVLDAIGDSYLTYTYTDISAGFFEKATEKFADHANKMEFRTFNADKAPSEQTFEEGSYDVIIAANVLHATRDLTQTMRHVRALLRPGGFLIAVEVTGTMLREPGLMGGLEGWWLGCDDGRFPSPGVTAEKWHEVLQSTGYSGIESIVYDMADISRHNCSVFVTQATDERFEVLRDPLAATDLIPETRVIVVGGKTLPVSKAVKRLERFLRRWTPDIMHFDSFENLDLAEVTPETSILSLTELDYPIFSQAMSAKKLESLQESLGSARNVLWVTSGRLAEDPHANMMIGIGRALSFELPHVNFQFLDLTKQGTWDMEITTQYLLRLVLLSSPEYHDHGMLWMQEIEVVMNGDTALVPRVVQDDDANQGLNAGRRRFTKLVQSESQVAVSYQSSQPCLVKYTGAAVPGDSVQIDVEMSVALQMHAPKSQFLCFGQSQNTKGSAFAITETDASIAIVKEVDVFESHTEIDHNAELIAAMRTSLIAQSLVSITAFHGTIILHNPTLAIAKAITAAAETTNQRVLVIRDTPGVGDGIEGIFIHPLAQPRIIRPLIPTDTTLVLRCSDAPIDNIASTVPAGCIIRYFDFALTPGTSSRAMIDAAFDASKGSDNSNSIRCISVSHVREMSGRGEHGIYAPPVLEWTRADPLEVLVPPLNFSHLFQSDKTYLMVGLAGELGQSLCRFMIRCGARHIVLASRNPTSNTDWLDDMDMEKGSSVQVKVVTMDVTDRLHVKKVASMIRETMPEIAGVANGALVLDDTLFVNATLSTIEKQLKPKVDGTIHLNDEFSQDRLDFFVAFSSLGSVYGNAGQSIYHAANMFMTSLIEKRRLEGKVGSVIDIGMIVDVGYVAERQRAGAKIEEHLRSQFYTPLAETEFHHLFAQAVLSGDIGSGNGNLIMGIQQFIDDPNASTRPHWYKNPRFSHMVVPPSASDGLSQAGNSMQQLREHFFQATSISDATSIFSELFCKKIEAMMKVPAASIDINAPLSDLGLDSLLAVEIRTWLLKDMRFDMPILKILGREPMLSICSDVAHKLLQERESSLGSRTDVQQAKNEIRTPPTASSVDGSISVDELSSSGVGRYRSPVSTAVTTDSDSILVPESKIPDIRESLSSKNSETSDNPSADDAIAQTEPQELDLKLEYSQVERMSFPQASLFFLQNFLDDATTFNVTAQYSITGELNVGRFERALQKAMAHHESYRTCFFKESGAIELKQAVTSKIVGSRFTYLPFGGDDEIQEAFDMLAKCNWRLGSGQTFKAILITHTKESHTLFLGCHHIVMDGMSWHIFLQDLDQAYRLLPLESPRLSLTDFARRQINALEERKLDNSLVYWKEHLNPLPPSLPLLSTAKKQVRLPKRVYDVHVLEKRLDSKSVQKIKLASQACGATPMQFYLAVLQALFSRLLDVDDICIGVADSGRGAEELNHTIGHFTNILPMRFRVSKETIFADLVQNTSQIVLDGYSHAQVPLDVIMEKLEMRRTSSSVPLFQVAFNYRVGDLLHGKLGNCSLSLDRYLDAKTPFDFTFNITQSADGGNMIEIFASSSLYSAETTAFMMDAFLKLVDDLSSNQSMEIQNCRPYEDAQIHQALRIGRGPRTQHAWPDTLTERFDQVVATYPSAIAIKDDKGYMTYETLFNRVNAIAATLQTANCKIGTRVGVICEPSVDTYAAMLAILRTGAVYVPLDMSLPVARRQVIIDACKTSLLLHHDVTAAAADECIGASSIINLNLDQMPMTTKQQSITAYSREAFLLFTSGSTGTPKGIRLSQNGIMNYAASKSEMLNLGQVKVLQQSSTGFDMSLAQAFNAFCNGGTLVVAPLKSRGDPVMISELMADEKIELTVCTPSEYLMLAIFGNDNMRRCKSWQHACSGGEAVTEALLTELSRLELPILSLVDCYGPTEISCAATFQQINIPRGAKTIKTPSSVGKAIPNTSVYIMDKDMKPLPVGCAGEIAIGGRGVANGYLDMENGKNKFVPDIFATSDDQALGWNMMYRTGDKGYLKEDGSLKFLGRIDGDTLIKLRGLRIELNEVAAAILETSANLISDVIVTVRGDPQFLVAHVVPTQGTSVSSAELDSICARLPLPRYMIPAMIIQVSRLPTTPNGKIDRGAVSRLELPDHGGRNEEEKKLTVPEGELRLIWREVLGESGGKATIEADTDFFTVGGSSLLLVHLQNTLKENMGIHMHLHELYQASTLRKMAAAASHERSQLARDSINWDDETEIPSKYLGKQQTADSTAPRRHQRRVAMTGSTGFLGSLILENFLKDSDIVQVLCIAVPKADRHKLPTDSKISVYTGSLLSPSLGLSDSEVVFLQANVDQFVHAGAQGHCLNSYTSVRNANYLSTQFLAGIALPRKVPVHFISSGRVILQSGACEAGPVSMAAHPPPVDGSQGFTSSKWASECFLEKMACKTGLPVAIHRPCSIIGARAPHNDAMNSVIKYSLLSRTVPDVPNAGGFFGKLNFHPS